MEEQFDKDEHSEPETEASAQEEKGGRQYMGGNAPQYENPYAGMYGAQPMPYMMPPMYGYMPNPYAYMPPPMYGYAPQPQYQPTEHEGCGHHQQEDPFGKIFGMFGEMLGSNPQLSSVGKMVDSTGSDFLKGILIGAGAAMLLSSDSVRGAIMDIFTKTMGVTEEEL